MIEGRPTGDGRFIEAGALRFPDLPLPLTWQKESWDGHDGEVVVGTIQRLSRHGEEIYGEGTLLDPLKVAEVADLMPRLEEGVLGLSASLDDATEEIVPVDEEGNVIPADDPRLTTPIDPLDPEAPVINAQQRVSDGRIRNAAIVTTPAFIECTIELLADDGEEAEEPPAPSGPVRPLPEGADGQPVAAALHASSCCLACQSGRQCDDAAPDEHVAPAAAALEARQYLAWRKAGRAGGSASAAARAAELAAEHALPYAAVKRLYGYFVRAAEHRDDEGWRQGDPGYPSPGRVTWAANGGDAAYAWTRSVIARTEGSAALTTYADVATSLAAASRPAAVDRYAPPAAWFTDPRLDGATALTVTPEGRLFGHLAPWNSCHMSVQERCLTPPRTRSGYAHFHQGRVRTAEGTVIPTGKVTVGTNHAGLELAQRPAAEHYEHTGHVVADVVAGEDAYGIWVAGALRPGVSADHLLALERSALSGDWRRVDGALELVAALAVNVPGFPVVGARVAGGQPAALVASGVVEADRRDRHREVERVGHDPRLEAAVEALAASIGRDRRSLVAALAADVHGVSA